MSTSNEVAIVLAAYVSNNDVDLDQLPEVADKIRVALGEEPYVEPEKFPGIVPRELSAREIREANSPSGLLCFEDGKRYKTLRRTIQRCGFSTPEQYLRKWGLPPDFPLTCADYGERRRQIAKEQGLGTKGA